MIEKDFNPMNFGNASAWMKANYSTELAFAYIHSDAQERCENNTRKNV